MLSGLRGPEAERAARPAPLSEAARDLVVGTLATAARRSAALTGAAGRATAADWRAAGAELERQRLLPLAVQRLTAARPASVPAELTARAEAIHAELRPHVAIRELIAVQALTALDDAGVRSVALKGTGLATRLYGDAALRPSSDIDVLVAAHELTAAVGALERLGWRASPAPLDAHGRPLLHIAMAPPAASVAPPVELHWRVHWYEERFAAEALARATRDAAGFALTPADDLAFLLLFYARDGFLGLRYLADIAAWWDAYGSPDVLAEVRELRGRHPQLSAALSAAARVADGLAGAPLAPVTDGQHGRRWKLAARSVALFPDPEEDPRAQAGLVDILLAPRGERLRTFVRRTFFPRAAIEGGVPRPSGDEGSPWLEGASHIARRLGDLVAVSRRAAGAHRSR